MKKILSLIVLFVGFIMPLAASNCSDRFDTEVFQTVIVTTNIVYGSNTSVGGGTATLRLDVYEPGGDTMQMRPLIIWVHGGSFVTGTKNDGDVTALCNQFAERGYVCASIDYRLGMGSFPPNAAEAKKAVFRAVQDFKAAVRFFRKDAATTNTFKIDPSLIFGGGSSAGGFTALHAAYLDKPSEIPADIDTTVLGNIEGESGNPGYSSEFNAVVNLCGALADKNYIEAGDIPFASMHGTTDATVPYSTSMIYLFGAIPVMVVDGSYALSDYANSTGIQNELYTFFGADHVPYAASAQYMDTTVRFVSNFLYRQLGCTPSDPNPLPNTFMTSAEENDSNENIHVFNSEKRIVVESMLANYEFTLYDISGKRIFKNEASGNHAFEIELSQGVYIYHVLSGGKMYSGKLVRY